VTTRVDVKLATYTFNKILQLPIDFFERTPAGEILRDMNEAWKVRTFLAQLLFGTLLDCILLFVFLPIMLFFSAVLTACVLGICGLICGTVRNFVRSGAAQPITPWLV
jgi:ATP-binding cassette subfamily B protein